MYFYPDTRFPYCSHCVRRHDFVDAVCNTRCRDLYSKDFILADSQDVTPTPEILPYPSMWIPLLNYGAEIALLTQVL
jgi:hypothetical protein